MSRRRKTVVGLAALAVLAVAAWSLRPRGYTYQGKTVEEWFREVTNPNFHLGARPDKRSLHAFVEMGTNAVPFLASRINRGPAPSLVQRWAMKLPARFRPAPKADEPFLAAYLLGECVKPPESMLREWLKPSLTSTNADRWFALRMALGGASNLVGLATNGPAGAGRDLVSP